MAGATRIVIDGVSYPVDDATAVDFEEQQTLTDAQKARARSNIGAASQDDMTSVQAAVGDVPSGSNLQGEVADLKSALDYIGNAISNEFPVDYSEYAATGVYISPSSGKWMAGGSRGYGIVPIPDNSYEVTVAANNTANGVIALLKTDSHTAGTYPDWATGENALRITPVGTTESYAIPSDCRYVYIAYNNGATDQKPTSVIVDYYVTPPVVDDTLTNAGEAADAKITGDGLRNLGKKVGAPKIQFTYALEGRYVKYDSGEKVQSTNFSVTNFILIEGLSKIAYSRIKAIQTDPAYGMAFFSSNETSAYISGIQAVGGESEAGSEIQIVDVPEGAKYAQFTWWSEALRLSRGEFELYDGSLYDPENLSNRVESIEEMLVNGLGETALVADVPQNEGVQNAILTAHQFTDIMWTPVADMPGIYRDPATQEISFKTHKKGCRQRGIPYCSGNVYAQRVNDAISFDTFATAVKNVNSVLYTQNEYAEGRKRAAYYGVACSKLVQACWGAPEFTDSQQIYKLPGIVKIADPGDFTVDDLQLGDGILNPQVHCTIVTGIFRNTKGQVVSVEISEAVMPTCRRLTWTKGEFYEHFETYGLYRYPQIVNAPYRKARYIDLDDGITAPEDIPIAIKRGSYINMSTSDSWKAVVDNTKWTTLHDVVNGEDVTSAIVSSEITLPNNRTGYHEIYPTDANGDRGNSSYYFVYDNAVSATVSGGQVTVTYTSNAPAVLIYFNSTNYQYIEEDTGSVTAEIPTGATSCSILFRSEYGTFFSVSMSLA